MFGKLEKRKYFRGKKSTDRPMDVRIEAFLRYIRYEKNYSEQTMRSYRQDLLQFEDFVIGLCGEFDPLHLDVDLARLWMADMAKNGAAVSSVKRRLCALRSFYKYLRRQKLIEGDSLRLLPTPKVSKSLPVWAREEQMEKVLDETDFGNGFIALRDRLLVDVLYSTGMRRAEIAALKDSDIDCASFVIKVFGKGGKHRMIPFGKDLAQSMQQYLEARLMEVGGKTEFFFVTPDGESLGVNRVYRIVRNRLSAIGNLSKRSPHVLRHSFATNMLNNGADLMAVKELLGHSTLDATEIYTHLTPQEILESYKQAHPRAENANLRKK